MGSRGRAFAEQIIQRIKEHGTAEKISELCLDQIPFGCFTLQTSSIIQKCIKVQHLSVSSCGLNSLQDFPKLAKLRYLDLQENLFTEKNLAQLESQLQTLQGLNISKNSINQIWPIIHCVNKLSIKQINIFQTTIFESNPKIIEILFENCKSLQCINWEDRRGKQVKEFEDDSSSSSERGDSSENDEKNQFQENESGQQFQQAQEQGSKKIKIE